MGAAVGEGRPEGHIGIPGISCGLRVGHDRPETTSARHTPGSCGAADGNWAWGLLGGRWFLGCLLAFALGFGCGCGGGGGGGVASERARVWGTQHPPPPGQIQAPRCESDTGGDSACIRTGVMTSDQVSHNPSLHILMGFVLVAGQLITGVTGFVASFFL